MKLQHSVALITGSSRGIGAAIAHALAREGARIALHYRNSSTAAEKVCESLPGNGHHLFQTDLAEEGQADHLFASVMTHFDQLDLLINNAGIFQTHDPFSTSPSRWRETWKNTLAVNLESPAQLCLLAAKRMAEQGGGRIINISSRGAFRGEPTAPAYAASKAGLNAFSQSMAQAFAPKNVLIYLIAPGFVETAMSRPHLQGEAGQAIKDQSPLKRVATVGEIAATALFLATDAPAFMTGAILDVNGAAYLRP